MKRPPTLETLINVTHHVLPHKPRGHSSVVLGVDAGAYKAPRIPAFSPCGLQNHCPLPPCPSHATSRTSVLASPSQSRRNNSYWSSGKPPSCSTSHVPDVPAAPARGLLRGGDSADYVANWGSKEMRVTLGALV